MEGGGFSRQNVEPAHDFPTTVHQKRRFCFFFRRNTYEYESRPDVGVSWWQKIRPPQQEIRAGNSIWARGLDALKRIRDWSEILAGPRWKTFIRRFNRDRNSSKHVNFHYDPLSYAMNFDEGPGQNGHFDDDWEEDRYFSRNFSSRYAKGSMDLGKGGLVNKRRRMLMCAGSPESFPSRDFLCRHSRGSTEPGKNGPCMA